MNWISETLKREVLQVNAKEKIYILDTFFYSILM